MCTLSLMRLLISFGPVLRPSPHACVHRRTLIALTLCTSVVNRTPQPSHCMYNGQLSTCFPREYVHTSQARHSSTLHVCCQTFCRITRLQTHVRITPRRDASPRNSKSRRIRPSTTSTVLYAQRKPSLCLASMNSGSVKWPAARHSINADSCWKKRVCDNPSSTGAERPGPGRG